MGRSLPEETKSAARPEGEQPQDEKYGSGVVKAAAGPTEHDLRAANERLEHALDAAGIGVWDWYPQTNRLVASKTAQALLGYAPGEYDESMESYWSRLHADDRELVEAAVRAVLQGHPEGDIEHRVVRPSGEVLWVLVRGKLERDEKDRPLRMSGTILDISARKRDDWAARLYADADAGMVSLDAGASLRGAARAIAHRFADWAFVHVRCLDGELLAELASSPHVPRASRDIVRELWARQVASSTDTVAAHQAVIDAIDPGSSMTLAMTVRPEVVGALTVARTRERGARFDDHDRSTFTELARRVSLRLENAFHHRAEQRQRARFQALVEASAEVVWTADERGSPAHELKRGRFQGIVHPEDREGATRAWQQAVESGTFYQRELRMLSADGTYRWVLVRATPVRDEQGKVVEWIGITNDVQTQHEMRARLEESEARYRTIVETANEGIATLDLAGRVTFANRRMAEMLDTTVEEVLGRSAFDYLFPEEVDAAKERRQQRLAGAPPTEEEMRLRSAKGREVWTRRAATPFHDDAGLVVGSIVILTDITEAKRAERYRARYELLARHAHDVVMFLRSTDGRILEVNDAAVHTYGHSHAEMLGMTISDLRAPETRAEVPETLRQARGEGRLFQTVHLRKDGTRFPVEISARGTVLEGEEVILSVVRDISARRRAEEEREQIERFRELFIGMLGHDLRNPLSAMLTGTALLLRRGTLSEGDERTVTRIHHSGSRMARMIEQLLDFTRVRVGRGIPIARRPIDLRDLVSHVVDELRAAHPDAAIALSIQGETRGEWDSDRLAQVFSNLIHNAIEHGKGDDPVRVSITGTSGQVEVSVHNRGEPIAPELLPVIFDPFRRDERRGDAKKRGLGLGLYIAQQIVLAHGGIVRVESSREEGTTFDVSLPAARPDR